jgi:hypothetical protein
MIGACLLQAPLSHNRGVLPARAAGSC